MVTYCRNAYTISATVHLSSASAIGAAIPLLYGFMHYCWPLCPCRFCADQIRTGLLWIGVCRHLVLHPTPMLFMTLANVRHFFKWVFPSGNLWSLQ